MVYCIRMEKRNDVPFSLSLSFSVFHRVSAHTGIQYWWSPFFHKQFRPNNSLYSWWNVLANLKGNYTSLLSLVNSREYETINWIFVVKISLEYKQVHFFDRSNGFRIHFLIILLLLSTSTNNNSSIYSTDDSTDTLFPISTVKRHRVQKSSKVENQFQFAYTFNTSKTQHFSLSPEFSFPFNRLILSRYETKG